MNKPGIAIVPAQKTDFTQLLGLWIKTELDLASQAEECQEYLMMLKLNPASCFVAKSKKSIVGSVLGIFNGRRAWIYHLAVDPNWQQQHIGSQLLQKAENALVKQGAAKVRLWVDFTNLNVVPFYKKHGYNVIPSDAIMLGKTIAKGGEIV